MTIERILGTDTGKEAFYKADRNFVALEKRPILNKAAAYTVVADDLNKTITVTGETTITLTAIATLGLGFRCRISNIGTGIISIVPSGTDTIATGTGITIYPGKCVEVVADYAGMWTVVGFDFTEVVNSLGAQINSLEDEKANKIQPDWLNAVLQNGATGTLLYRKNQIDQLEIKTSGNLVFGTITEATVIATLPNGYRPTVETVIMVYNTATNRGIPFLTVTASGNVIICANSGITAGQNTRFSAVCL